MPFKDQSKTLAVIPMGLIMGYISLPPTRMTNPHRSFHWVDKYMMVVRHLQFEELVRTTELVIILQV